MPIGTRVSAVVARVRWYELLPEVVLATGLGLFALTERRAAAAAFKSTTAVALMMTVTVAWVVARAALWAGVRRPAIRLAVFAAAAAAILKVVVLPSYADHAVDETRPTATAAVRSGPLHGIDHRATGRAALYLSTDGHPIIGLEQLDIQPGPAYAVYIVPGADRHDPDGGIRVERLRGNKGNQFYDAPPEADVTSQEWTLLVWCETFDVPVANSTPTPI